MLNIALIHQRKRSSKLFEEIRKGLISGFGAFLLTREKAQEVADKFVEEAKISKEEANKFIDELYTVGTKRWSEVETNLSEVIRKGFENMDLASKKELHGLKSKVGKLEKRLKTIEHKIKAYGDN
jgi:polyhydroxyalkanoate synthesis regulator phasin